MFYVEIPRSRYLGRRSLIEVWHQEFDLPIDVEFLYSTDESGIGQRMENGMIHSYRYAFPSREMADTFKLLFKLSVL